MPRRTKDRWTVSYESPNEMVASILSVFHRSNLRRDGDAPLVFWVGASMTDDEERCSWCGFPWSLHPRDADGEAYCTKYPPFQEGETDE